MDDYIKELGNELTKIWSDGLKSLGVKLPTGKNFNKLLCLFDHYPYKVSQEEISDWHRRHRLPEYDLQARHLADMGWDVRSGNTRFTRGVIDPDLSFNELRLANLKTPNPIWIKDDVKRINNLAKDDWNQILELFRDRGCAVCGRHFKHYDKGHLLKSKSYEKGNIVPMCSECNNWGLEVEFKMSRGLVARPIVKK
jgi:hypothetical protein